MIRLEAGTKEQLGTCPGGLIAVNNSGIVCRVEDTLVYRVTSEDLFVLACSLKRREEGTAPKPQENRK